MKSINERVQECVRAICDAEDLVFDAQNECKSKLNELIAVLKPGMVFTSKYDDFCEYIIINKSIPGLLPYEDKTNILIDIDYIEILGSFNSTRRNECITVTSLARRLSNYVYFTKVTAKELIDLNIALQQSTAAILKKFFSRKEQE